MNFRQPLKIIQTHELIRMGNIKMRVIIIFAFMLLFAGCATNPQAEQQRATKLMEYKIHVYGPACEKLGFTKDTDAWRECIQREYEQTIAQQQRNWDHPYWSPYYGRPFYYRR